MRTAELRLLRVCSSPLFAVWQQKTLKLVETKTFASGVVVLSYEPVAKGDEK
jgi:hypothetical protein